ncbi:CheR family methyltransferase [Candidatus Riflebacteria bacterium]
MKLKQEDFINLRTTIQQLSGISLGDEKKYLVEQRLGPIVKEFGCKSFSDLYTLLGQNMNNQLQDRVIEAITTNETFFFRDENLFNSFRKIILPQLDAELKQRKGKAGLIVPAKINIWCAATSTGQEPYSLAMLLYEFCENSSNNFNDYNIFCTDISDESLSRAKKGEYGEHELERGLDNLRKEKFFKKKGESNWVINPELKKIIEFRKMNLCKPFQNIGNYDIIFCRNVLIYFDIPTKIEVVEKLHERLHKGGWLILGASESLYCISEKFNRVSDSLTILYRKE